VERCVFCNDRSQVVSVSKLSENIQDEELAVFIEDLRR
jgi:hypothetical protein